MGDDIIEETLEEEEPETLEVDDIEGDDIEETPETVDSADSDTALKESDEDKGPPATVPYDRFKQVNDRAKRADEIETKFDQFKRLGPEGYYTLYPDEKPQDEQEPEQPLADGHDVDVGNMTVTGGPYAGQTLNEVFKVNPVEGTRMLKDHWDAQEAEANTEKKRKADLETEVQADIDDFHAHVAKEFFDKDFDSLSEAETQQAMKVESELAKFIQDNKMLVYRPKDAYILMTHAQKVAEAKGETLKGVVDALNKDGTPSISSGKTPSRESGYSRFSGMSVNEAMSEMDKMTDSENAEFLKKAPESVRKKFPQFPWDD